VKSSLIYTFFAATSRQLAWQVKQFSRLAPQPARQAGEGAVESSRHSLLAPDAVWLGIYFVSLEHADRHRKKSPSAEQTGS